MYHIITWYLYLPLCQFHSQGSGIGNTALSLEERGLNPRLGEVVGNEYLADNLSTASLLKELALWKTCLVQLEKEI